MNAEELIKLISDYLEGKVNKEGQVVVDWKLTWDDIDYAMYVLSRQYYVMEFTHMGYRVQKYDAKDFDPIVIVDKYDHKVYFKRIIPISELFK